MVCLAVGDKKKKMTYKYFGYQLLFHIPQHKKMLATILLLVVFISQSLTCPFYQNVPTNTTQTTNFTTLGAAMNASMANDFCVIVCNGALVGFNETLPVITSSICIMGETQVGTVLAYLTIENNITTPTFLVNASNTARVVFENINIVNSGTLFEVIGQSQLTLLNTRCFFGNVCVKINTTTINALLPPGVLGDTVTFMSNAIPVEQITGWFYCTHCTFYDSLTAALLTRNPSSNPWQFFVLYDQTFVNVIFPYALQPYAGAVLSPPAGITANFVDSTNLFDCQTYTQFTSFGAAGDCPACAACPSTPSVNIVQILFAIGIWLLIFACYAVCCRRNKSDKSKKTGGD